MSEQIQNKDIRHENDLESRAVELTTLLKTSPGNQEGANSMCRTVLQKSGPAAACQIISRSQLLLGLRRPRIAIYDHTWHFIGGAQKYGATIAEALSSAGEITLMGNRPFSPETLAGWYRLNLSHCNTRIVPMPFFEDRKEAYIDPAIITSRTIANPFHAVSRASLDYDLFINNSMLEMVYPLSHRSAFITHFPERLPRSYFYVDRYSRIVYNSRYTKGWIEKRWSLSPHTHIYPPVDMPDSQMQKKESIILSVARFDPGGNKQQLDMLRAFELLHRSRPDICLGWRLVLAGGSFSENPYLSQVQAFVTDHPKLPVDLYINASHVDLTALYHKASLFWHFCGLGQNDPALVEHFGMTVAEAMQNGCIPLVFDGGGMREIVENNRTGQLFSSMAVLLQQSIDLLTNPQKRELMSQAARDEGQRFSKEVFTDRIRKLAAELLDPGPLTNASGH